MKVDKVSFPLGIKWRQERSLDISNFSNLEPPLIMGVLNVTPDSFSDGGNYHDPEKAIKRAMKMVEQGADIVDVGGESTRPFSEEISPEKEISRVLPVIEKLVEEMDVPVSVDTRHPETARKCIDAGACILNDVSGLRDEAMRELVLETGVSVVIMHMKGNPKVMQENPVYDDVVDEVGKYLVNRAKSLTSEGFDPVRIFIDPGIGFGKTVEHNLLLIKHLDRLANLGYGVLIGPSRKSFIGKILDLDVGQRLEGSLVSAVVSTMNGASIIRMHDIEETYRSIKLLKSIQHPEKYSGM